MMAKSSMQINQEHQFLPQLEDKRQRSPSYLSLCDVQTQLHQLARARHLPHRFTQQKAGQP